MATVIEHIGIYWRSSPYRLLQYLDLECSANFTKYDIACYYNLIWSNNLYSYRVLLSKEWAESNQDAHLAFFGSASGGAVTPTALTVSNYSERNGCYFDNSSQFSYCYKHDTQTDTKYNIYIFPSQALCEQYLTKQTKEEKDAFAKQYADNEVKSPEPYIDFVAYLSKEKSPLIDLVWKLQDNDNDNVSWDKINIYLQVMQGVLPSELKYYTTVNPSELHWSSTFEGLRGIMKQLFPLLSIGTQVYRIYADADYTLGGVPKITNRVYFQVQAIENSVNNPHGILVELDNTTIEIRMGYAEEDEDYIDYLDNISPFKTPSESAGDGSGYSANGIGCRQYILTKAKVNELIAYMWSSNLIENIKKVQQNPIENIVSCKIFPFDFSGTAGNTVHIGNVDTEISAPKLPDTYNAIRTVATFTVQPYYYNFLDYDFTNLSIYLPFIGIRQLDSKICMGKTLNVQYVVDVVTGACTCSIFVEGALQYKYSGSMGIDIALSSSNRVELEKSYIQSAVSTALSLASENYGGAISNALAGALSSAHTQTSGSFAPNCEGYSDRHIYLIYDRPVSQVSEQYKHTHGLPCQLSLNLSGLRGYTRVAEGVDLSGIPCGDDEKQMIHDILTSGFYI